METTYQKDGDTLKITTPIVSTVSVSELLAEKNSIQSEIDATTSAYTEVQAARKARLTEVDDLLAKAEELGVSDPEEELSA